MAEIETFLNGYQIERTILVVTVTFIISVQYVTKYCTMSLGRWRSTYYIVLCTVNMHTILHCFVIKSFTIVQKRTPKIAHGIH